VKGTVLLLLCSMGAGTAQAWGPDGHEIVGRIAELHLTEKAQREIYALLNGGNTNSPSINISDDEVANWADYVRPKRRETAPWHFVDIPFDAEKYDPVRDCDNHDGCVVEAIQNLGRALTDPESNQKERTEALKFIVHFVGDIHQPLHCSERNGDKGGNLCTVRYPGKKDPAKLHVVWDIFLVTDNLKARHMGPIAYADYLNEKISPEQKQAWSTGTPAEWAWESHVLGVTRAYDTIPTDCPSAELSDDYVTKNRALVDEQFIKAGLRLARFLNEAFK
jgi:hypothetical protein